MSFPTDLILSEADQTALLEVLLSRTKPKTHPAEVHWGDANATFRAATLRSMLAYAYDVPASRVRFIDIPTNELFDLQIAAKAGRDDTKAAVQRMLGSGLRLRVTRSKVVTRALLLEITSVTLHLITPTASTRGALPMYKNGVVQVVNVSMDELASALEAVIDGSRSGPCCDAAGWYWSLLLLFGWQSRLPGAGTRCYPPVAA